MSVSCEFCVLSGRGLCVGLITSREESYRVEASTVMRPWPRWGVVVLGKSVVWNEKSRVTHFMHFKVLNVLLRVQFRVSVALSS